MALFQLDPQSIATRAQASRESTTRVPSLRESLWRGALGFTVVSVAGFAPWAIFERWFRSMRETELYIACTLAFIAASGPLLHRLIIGPGSLSRFYKLFAVAFSSYAAAWIALWVGLRGESGVFFGLLAGSFAMGAVIALAFAAPQAMLKVIAAIFVGNAAGYYAGEWLHAEIGFDYRYLSMAAWGICYGLGFGAGLGLALFFSQTRARTLLARAAA